MKYTLIFMKRNLKEMLREPLNYFFCLGFPIILILLFQIIEYYVEVTLPIYLLRSLIPGIMMFSLTFVMLSMSLLISKDRSTSFLKRLYSSPLKPINYILGYAIPGIIIGILQMIICEIVGFIVSLLFKDSYFTIFEGILLIISQFPILVICVFGGLLFGTILSDKSAPGVVSIIVNIGGILGGAWMPIDSMGNFEKICNYLPFYPSVRIGRVITKAINSYNEVYYFDNKMFFNFVIIGTYLLIIIILSIVCFKKQMTLEK